MKIITKTNGFSLNPFVTFCRAVILTGVVSCVGGVFGQTLPAQSVAAIGTGQPAPPDSIVQLTAEAQDLALVPPDQLPPFGTFWLVQPGAGGCIAVPLPCPPFDPTLPVYAIADGQFLVDATANTSGQSAAVLEAQASAVVNLIAQVQTAAASQQLQTMARAMGMDDPSPPGAGSGDDSGGDYSPAYDALTIDTNALWLEITNVANGLADLNLHNATNQVYAIWTTTNLVTSWQVETELWPTTDQTNVLPFTVPTLNQLNLFVRAEDWTGVDSDGDGLPDWWEWKYFGNFNHLGSDYDCNGNTLLYDYQHGIDPTLPIYDPTGSLTFTNGLKLFIFEPKPASCIP